MADCATTRVVPPPDPTPPDLSSKGEIVAGAGHVFHSASDVFDSPDIGRSFGGYVLVYLTGGSIEVQRQLQLWREFVGTGVRSHLGPLTYFCDKEQQLKVTGHFLVCLTTDWWQDERIISVPHPLAKGRQQCLCFLVVLLRLDRSESFVNQRRWCNWVRRGTVDGIVSPGIRHD